MSNVTQIQNFEEKKYYLISNDKVPKPLENISTFTKDMYQEIHCETVEIDSNAATFKTYLKRKS